MTQHKQNLCATAEFSNFVALDILSFRECVLYVETNQRVVRFKIRPLFWFPCILQNEISCRFQLRLKLGLEPFNLTQTETQKRRQSNWLICYFRKYEKKILIFTQLDSWSIENWFVRSDIRSQIFQITGVYDVRFLRAHHGQEVPLDFLEILHYLCTDHRNFVCKDHLHMPIRRKPTEDVFLLWDAFFVTVIHPIPLDSPGSSTPTFSSKNRPIFYSFPSNLKIYNCGVLCEST